MSNNPVYAEDINYWQTSKSAADTWIARARKEIESISGKIMGEAFGSNVDGKAAFMLSFKIGEDRFKVVWPVLPSKTNKSNAAKIQAATLLYHDIKHKVVMAKVKGVRTAFVEYLLLPNGQTVNEAVRDTNQFLDLVPPQIIMLGSGE